MTRRVLVGLGLVLAIGAIEGQALAQVSPARTAEASSAAAESQSGVARRPQSAEQGPPSSPALRRPWYGWQLLPSDALSVSLMGLGLGLDSGSDATRGNGLIGTGALVYALTPPLIHLQHGRPGMAVASLSVRVMVPVAARSELQAPWR